MNFHLVSSLQLHSHGGNKPNEITGKIQATQDNHFFSDCVTHHVSYATSPSARSAQTQRRMCTRKKQRRAPPVPFRFSEHVLASSLLGDPFQQQRLPRWNSTAGSYRFVNDKASIEGINETDRRGHKSWGGGKLEEINVPSRPRRWKTVAGGYNLRLSRVTYRRRGRTRENKSHVVQRRLLVVPGKATAESAPRAQR